MNFLDSREEMLSLDTNSGDMAPEDSKNFPPYLHDVRWENIKAVGPCKVALRIAGHEDMFIEDIVLRNVEVGKANKTKEIKHARNIVMQSVSLAGEAQDPNAANLPPDVYAGPDQIADPNNKTVSLKGTVTNDGPPENLKYQWSVKTGDSSAVKFDTPQAITTKATFSKNGTYTLKLTANNGKSKAHHTTTIQIGPDPEDH
jgi:hypothetical protein